MPELKIIITLNNTDDAPEDVRMHVDSEPSNPDDNLSEGGYVLEETALLLCDSLIKLLQGQLNEKTDEDNNLMDFIGTPTGNA